MVTDFIDKKDKLKNKKLFETEELFQKNKHQFIQLFIENFNTMCDKMIHLQKNCEISEISYLEYTMLYTNFFNRIYQVDVRVYNEDWYLDKNQISIGFFDVSFLFEKFDELWNELNKLSKRYVGVINNTNISENMISVMPDFFSYIVTICRFGILSIIKNENFQNIKKADAFEINVGDYMVLTEPIYKENKQKDQESILSWFQEHLDYEYAYEDFSGLDFQGEDFSQINLCYSDLRNTNLNHVNFQNSMLIGTRFCNANMNHVDMKNCLLYEADFTGTDLSNARFNFAKGKAGTEETTEWSKPGYMEVNFQNANLQNADFTESNFVGSNFANAIMNGALFCKEQVEQLNLSEEQFNVIVIQ